MNTINQNRKNITNHVNEIRKPALRTTLLKVREVGSKS